MAKYHVKVIAWKPDATKPREWWADARSDDLALHITLWSGPTKKAAIAELRRLLAQMPDVEIVEEKP